MVIKKAREKGIVVKEKAREKGVKVKEKAGELRKETRKHITTAIAAAFAFVIALVWRDAIRKIIDNIVAKLGLPETVYVHEIIIAIIITIIAVIGIMIVSKYSIKEK